MKSIFLDYAATTPTDARVVAAMQPYFNQKFGNPSSIYSLSREPNAALQQARAQIAGLINADSKEIIFTSGGTESNNFALKGMAYAHSAKGNHIITSAIEHHAISAPCKFLESQGFRVTYLPVDATGIVAPESVRQAITDKTILISIMHANNEIGTVQPIAEIGKIARTHGIPLHTDAVQTVGHLPIDVKAMNIDLLSASAHKLYGPRGVGALYLRKGIKIEPFLHGGDQENRRRASTENMPAIVGFGKAVALAQCEMTGEARRLTRLRDQFIEGVRDRIPDVQLNGHPEKRLPNNINFTFTGIEGEAMVLNLDMEGIYVSTGSACTSATLEASHVLLALGLPHELAHASLRFTMGRQTSADDMAHVLTVLPKVIARLRAMSPIYKK